VITARGGSRGIPHKNIRALNGKPLLWYTADAALSSHRLERVILSTNDHQIAQVGQQCGLEVPFLRPEELSRDDTPSLPVVQHAVRFVEQNGELYDAVCLLQPTNPMRRPEHIDACIELLDTSGVDAVITVLPIPERHNPHWVYFQDKHGLLRLSTGEADPIPRRQDLPPAFCREGSVYVTRRDVLMEGNSLYGSRVRGYRLAPVDTVNIDSYSDWGHAERLLKNG
jgi:CMP-N-acetylneuraminic acid synthetase